MTYPAFFYGLLLSSLYGTAFHFWKGGKGIKLLFYVLLSWIGFWLGHFLGVYMSLSLAKLGPLNAGLGTIFSILFLFTGNWLSKVDLSD